MKIVLNIELAQAIQLGWMKLLGNGPLPSPVAAPHPEASLFVVEKYEGCIHKENGR
ncbi:MAG: hypothetical protein NPIRA06_14670 [Nitrospirales bacterium]|nr:MAG: hypothetical protein NPIRA06_14670 [Nitrospirales bacterium]